MTSAQRRRIRKYADRHGISFEEARRWLGVRIRKDGSMIQWFEDLGRADRATVVLDAFRAAEREGAWDQAVDLGRRNKTLAVHTAVTEGGSSRDMVIHLKMPTDGNAEAVRFLLQRIEEGTFAFRPSMAIEGELAIPAMFADGAYEEAGRYYMLEARDMGEDAILFRVGRFHQKPDLLS